MKSWADECSSDEGGEIRHPPTSAPAVDEKSDSDDDYDLSPSPPKPVLPRDPPFTAFVGNLSFEIQNAQHLAYELEEACVRNLGRKVVAVDGRLMTDRETGKKKGYGYIEFETAEDLATVLELSNNTDLYGRTIRIDIANTPKNRPNNYRNRDRDYRDRDGYNRSSSITSVPDVPDDYGRQFQGGRHTSNNVSGAPNPTILRRENSSNSSSGLMGQNNFQTSGGDETKTRPTLKLKPRSKPLGTSTEDETKSTSASIFGEGRTREEVIASSSSIEPTAILKRSTSEKNEKNYVNPTPVDLATATPSTVFEESTKNNKEKVVAPSSKNHRSHEMNNPNQPVKGKSDNTSTTISSDKNVSKSKSTSSPNANGIRRGSEAKNDRRRDSRNHGGGRSRGGRGGGRTHERQGSSGYEGRGGRGGGRREPKKKTEMKPKGKRGSKSGVRVNQDGWGEAPATGKVKIAKETTEKSASKRLGEEIVKVKVENKIRNSFAALGFDSDSD